MNAAWSGWSSSHPNAFTGLCFGGAPGAGRYPSTTLTNVFTDPSFCLFRSRFIMARLLREHCITLPSHNANGTS